MDIRFYTAVSSIGKVYIMKAKDGIGITVSRDVDLAEYINKSESEIIKLQADVESLKCCGNGKNDIYYLSPVCVQCTRGVQITTASDKKDNWESK